MAGDGLREAAVEAMVTAACTTGDFHLRCSYPECRCLTVPDAVKAALTALLAMLDQRGFAVVPKVATEDAQDNGREEILSSAIIEHEDEGPFIFIGTNAMQAIYAALLAVAPNPLEAPDGQ